MGEPKTKDIPIRTIVSTQYKQTLSLSQNIIGMVTRHSSSFGYRISLDIKLALYNRAENVGILEGDGPKVLEGLT